MRSRKAATTTFLPKPKLRPEASRVPEDGRSVLDFACATARALHANGGSTLVGWQREQCTARSEAASGQKAVAVAAREVSCRLLREQTERSAERSVAAILAVFPASVIV